MIIAGIYHLSILQLQYGQAHSQILVGAESLEDVAWACPSVMYIYRGYDETGSCAAGHGTSYHVIDHTSHCS